MTNEEAKNILFDLTWSDDIDGWALTSRENEAVSMAIKALEKQDQYEKALAFSCEAIKCDVCPVLDCTEEHNAECPEIILAYIKKAYGLEER